MQLVFDFTVVETVRPSNFEACLFILKDSQNSVQSGTYYSEDDIFQVDEVCEYPADVVLYWTKSCF